jgi:branched-chain amino acid transport system substrate-binding protein
VITALEGLTFQGLGREVTIREDHQGIEAQLLGTSVQSGDYPFATLGNIMIFDGEGLTAPVGEESVAWVSKLTPDFINGVKVDTYEK